MKYFSAILLIFATILGIVACILPYWSMGNSKQITSGTYNINTGKTMNAGLWGYCYSNAGSTKIGNAGCGTFDIDSWPTSENSKGLRASRYLSIISISLTVITAIMVYFTQNKTAYIVMCSLVAALIVSLLVVYYVLQQPLLSSMHNNYKCLGNDNCTGGATASATAKNYGNLCTMTTNVCQVCGVGAAKAAGNKNTDGEWDVTYGQPAEGHSKGQSYDVRYPSSCTSDDDCAKKVIVKSTSTSGSGKPPEVKCVAGACQCPKQALMEVDNAKRMGNCTSDISGGKKPGAAGLYLSKTIQAPNNLCTPTPGACMYIQIGAALLVIGSIFALPGFFVKKNSKSK
mgnify:CR=1 FL=1